MKKKLVALLALGTIASLTGCGNYQMLDTTYTVDRAIIKLPNGEIVDGKVEKWTDYEGEQLQVTIDGVTYLVHANNATLIAE